MKAWFLVIALIGNGGADIQTIPMWTEESCMTAKHKVEEMSNRLHATCVVGR